MPYAYTLTYCNYFYILIQLATAFSIQLHSKTQNFSLYYNIPNIWKNQATCIKYRL
jgi:hypothetical protein